MAALLDLNVLLALMHARHSHSRRAIQWLEQNSFPGAALTCRVTQMGALRLVTRSSVMKNDVLSASEFWEGWKQLISDVRFSFVEEPAGFQENWQGITQSIPKGSCAETDAYLAAMARTGGWTLVTFNQVFRRVDGLALEILI